MVDINYDTVFLQSMLEVSETTLQERVGDVLLCRAAVWVDVLQIRWDGGLYPAAQNKRIKK